MPWKVSQKNLSFEISFRNFKLQGRPLKYTIYTQDIRGVRGYLDRNFACKDQLCMYICIARPSPSYPLYTSWTEYFFWCHRLSLERYLIAPIGIIVFQPGIRISCSFLIMLSWRLYSFTITPLTIVMKYRCGAVSIIRGFNSFIRDTFVLQITF